MVDVYDESDEFFKNKSETNNSTQSKAVASSEEFYYCAQPLEVDGEHLIDERLDKKGDQMCDSKKRNVWPSHLRNLDNNFVPILRKNSVRVEIEECL